MARSIIDVLIVNHGHLHRSSDRLLGCYSYTGDMHHALGTVDTVKNDAFAG